MDGWMNQRYGEIKRYFSLFGTALLWDCKDQFIIAGVFRGSFWWHFVIHGHPRYSPPSPFKVMKSMNLYFYWYFLKSELWPGISVEMNVWKSCWLCWSCSPLIHLHLIEFITVICVHIQYLYQLLGNDVFYQRIFRAEESNHRDRAEHRSIEVQACLSQWPHGEIDILM